MRLENRLAPAVFTVTNTADSGVGSLRQAVLDAFFAWGADTIDFLPSLFNVAQTINLTTGYIGVGDATTILGPGSQLLTVKNLSSLKSHGGVFEVEGQSSATLSGMRITNGNTTGFGGAINIVASLSVTCNDMVFEDNRGGVGGAVSAQQSNVTLNNCIFKNNVSTANDGGALYSEHGKATVNSCSFISNTATSEGGGVFVNAFSSIVMDGCILSNNKANGGSGGGMNILHGSNAKVQNSTFAGNVAVSYGGGLGVDASFQANAVVSNCTFTANQAGIAGGGVMVHESGDLAVVFRNSTIVGNTAIRGGGMAMLSAAKVDLAGCIVAKNTVTNGGPDLDYDSAQTATASSCLIGVSDQGNFTLPAGNLSGTKAAPLDPGVITLANNGGAVPTIGLLLSSPAIDAGANPLSLANDARGAGFPRVVGMAADIGAFEVQDFNIAANATAPSVTKLDTTSFQVTVHYADGNGSKSVDVGTIDVNDITISGPGFPTPATPLSVVADNPGNGSPRIATYTFAAPSGGWNFSHNGIYSIAMKTGQVSDLDSPTPVFVPAGPIGTMNVAVGKQFIVDDFSGKSDGNYSVGNLSMIEAVNLANYHVGFADLIAFDPLAVAMSKLVTSGGELIVTESLTVRGPNVPLTVRDNSRGFQVTGPNPIQLTIENLTIGGTAASQGGALANFGHSVMLSNVTIANSSSGQVGGGIYSSGGSLTMFNCTVIGNIAKGPNGTGFGAGIYVFKGSLEATNCTLTGNSANVDGGAIYNHSTTVAIIQNCTITNNTAATGGGIISNTSTVQLTSTIVAGNTATVAGKNPDLSGGSFTATDCIIGVTGTGITSITIVGGKSGTLSNPFQAKLAPIYDNGGLTLTHAPLPGSPALNAGSNPIGLAFDQRGAGFPRVLAGVVDIGAIEGISQVPTATAALTNVTLAGPTSYTFTVKYEDPTGIDVATLGTGDVVITGPNGFMATPAFVSVDIAGNGTPRTATYSFVPPGGSWDKGDNGNYTLAQVSNQVGDTDAKQNFAFPGVIGTFNVSAATLYLVDEISDVDDGIVSVGKLSIREAASLANKNTALSDVIMFDPTVFAAATTITFNGGPIQFTEKVSVIGPTAALTFDALGTKQLVTINAPASDTIGFERLTFSNGRAVSTSGGAIQVVAGRLNLNTVVIENCVADAGGGAVSFVGSAAWLTANDCFIRNNQTLGTSKGGGILSLATSGTMTLTRTTVSNNQSGGDGGGISTSSSLKLDASLVANNSVAPGKTGSGGGIAIAALTPSSANLTVSNSTISGNTTGDGGFGGGVFVKNLSSSVSGSTVALNLAKAGGGGLAIDSGTLTLAGTRIALNSAASHGGGVWLSNSPTLIDISSITSNNSGGHGGGAYGTGGFVTVSASTLDGNVANLSGGGLNQINAGILIVNSTVSGNHAGVDGGGIVIATSNTWTVNIHNSTLTANTAQTGNGGGLARFGSDGTFTIASSVVSKNFNAAFTDVYSVAKISVSTSAIGNGNFGFSDGGGNRPFGEEPLLAALADNGGPTKTHRLLPGSPLINNGSNPSNLTTDQRAAGFKRAVGPVDIGAYEVQMAPKVLSVQLNDGSAQRSRVTSITVTFDGPVVLPANPATSFELVRQSDGAIVELASSLAGNSVTLTFTGGAVNFTSLADGRYTLTALASLIRNADALLDGDGNGVGGDNYVLIGNPVTNKLFRLFGDSDGDGTISANDFIQFRLSLGANNTVFDFDNDGAVAASDFIQFRLRFGSSV